MLYQACLITHYKSPYTNKLHYSKYTNGKNIYILGSDHDNYYIYDFQYYNTKTRKHTYHWLDKKNALFEFSTDFSIAFQGENKIDTCEITIFDKDGYLTGNFFTVDGKPAPVFLFHQLDSRHRLRVPERDR